MRERKRGLKGSRVTSGQSERERGKRREEKRKRVVFLALNGRLVKHCLTDDVVVVVGHSWQSR